MRRIRRTLQWTRLLGSRPARLIALAAAALPVFQTTGCYPDPIGALDFQLQLLINGVLINAVNIVVQNLLHL